jgi:hypothetical protein
MCACILREKLWNPTLPGRYIDTSVLLITSSGINMVSNITILILPLVTIWKLKLPFKSKYGVVALFSIGALYILDFGLAILITASALRFVTSPNVASAVRFYYTLRLTESHDVTYSLEPFAYWA